ncbi:MAG: hypothetical protein NTZ84_01975 [Candidatus Nealsonbacteria bacterium]|nr:hypothetical protein [Candidatus Nealsonbacteria bacterium]
MKKTKERPVSLRDFQEMFKGIYYDKDKRDYTSADLLLHVQEEAAKIDEGMRKTDKSEIVRALPNLFCWLLSFCNMEGIDAESVIFSKYGGCCPYCGKEENCMCITMDQKSPYWHASPNASRPIAIYGLQEMFKKIYGRINKMAWRIQIWLHVHEELGEFSREFRLRNESEAAEELADCFAWLFAFSNKMGVDLGENIWIVYPGECSVCRAVKCQCPKV